MTLCDYFGRSRICARFDPPLHIFRARSLLHAALKNDYFLVTSHTEEAMFVYDYKKCIKILMARGIPTEEEAIESTRMDVLA